MPKTPTQRRLEEMFVIGKPMAFNDGRGEPVVVWLQKLNPIQLGQAIRRANAARARIRSVRSAPNSEEYELIWGEVLDLGDHPDLVRTLLAETMVTSEMRAEAQLAAEEEWSDEEYLQGLRDTWNDGMSLRHLAEPDPESTRVFDELKRFETKVAEMTHDEVEAARVELESQSIEDLRARAMERQMRHLGGAAWMDEIRRCELWLGVRTPCAVCADVVAERVDSSTPHAGPHRERYFLDRAEVEELQGEPLNALLAAYQELSVDVVEGKDSGPTQDSESSSGSQPEPATEPGSGPVTASV